MTALKCRECKTSLTQLIHNGLIWYNCKSCGTGLTPIAMMSSILSEFEYNKLVHEIKKAQVISSENCPQCTKPMVQIIDLVYTNEVEACSSCQLIWLDPNEGQKIKNDQTIESNTEKKVTLSQYEPLSIVEQISKGGANRDRWYDSPISSGFKSVFQSAVSMLNLEGISKNNPIFAFSLLVLVLIFLIYILTTNPGLFRLVWLSKVLGGLGASH